MTQSTKPAVRIWDRFPAVFAAIKASHESAELRGHHDIHHAARVGEMARLIALEEWRDEETADMAGLAGLCHNADHVFQAKLKKIGVISEEADDDVSRLVTFWLDQDERLKADAVARNTIVDAVECHTRKNGADDSRVLIALMDADRVVNLALDVVMRAGQYHAGLPAVDYRHKLDDPQARYTRPGSVLKDVWYCTEWADPKTPVCVRTAYARREAENRVVHIHRYMDTVLNQIKEEGPLPW